MHGNLVAIVPHFLQLLVVGVLVGHVEGGLEWVEGQLQNIIQIIKLNPRTFTYPNGTSVGILPIARKQHLIVQIPVVLIDGVIERQHDHLWRLVTLQIAWNACAILRTETIREEALRVIAGAYGIRIVHVVTPALVRSIQAVHAAVTKVLLRQTTAIGAAQFTVRTLGGSQERFRGTFLCNEMDV